MAHPLVLALFDSAAAAALGARAAHEAGIGRDDLSIVAKNHREEGELARQMDGSPGVDIEDSRPAARVGEIGAQLLAAIAIVLPGIGPIVAGGPLGAALGEAAGHMAGGVASILEDAGLDARRARSWSERIERNGAVLLGAHVRAGDPAAVEAALLQSGARETSVASWRDDSSGG
jgi:hypothetical protein